MHEFQHGAKLVAEQIVKEQLALEEIEKLEADLCGLAHSVVNHGDPTERSGRYKGTEQVPIPNTSVGAELRQILRPPDNRLKTGLFFAVEDGEPELVALFGSGEVQVLGRPVRDKLEFRLLTQLIQYIGEPWDDTQRG